MRYIQQNLKTYLEIESFTLKLFSLQFTCEGFCERKLFVGFFLKKKDADTKIVQLKNSISYFWT